MHDKKGKDIRKSKLYHCCKLLMALLLSVEIFFYEEIVLYIYYRINYSWLYYCHKKIIIIL